jgi:DNA-binding NtrC family response regulator
MAHILILDGYPWVRELYKEELVDDGHRVEATGQKEPVEAQVRDFKPDLVLLDLYINGRDRWDVLKNLKESYPNLPILIVTGYAGYRQDPRSILADGFVTKSGNCDGLKRKIAQVFKNKKKKSVPGTTAKVRKRGLSYLIKAAKPSLEISGASADHRPFPS